MHFQLESRVIYFVEIKVDVTLRKAGIKVGVTLRKAGIKVGVTLKRKKFMNAIVLLKIPSNVKL